MYLSEISEKDLNCVRHLLNKSQRLKVWDELKQKHSFHENKRFLFMQLLHVIPKSWKNNLSDVKENIHNLVFQDHNTKTSHVISK